MKRTMYFLYALLLGLPFLASAQHQHLIPCATPPGKVDWLVQYQQNPPQLFVPEDTLWVPLTIHLVADDNGVGYFDGALVLQQICTLNEDFAPSGIQFYIKGEYNYIANSTYNNHNFSEGADMMDEYNVDKTINCYIVDSPAGACGYSAYNLGIALNEDCIQPGDHTWAHEVGHFLSLPHVFVGWEGTDYYGEEPAPFFLDNGAEVELLDGSNCQTAGDGFCDTPADYISYRWGCQNNGFSNQVNIDPTGAEFEADGSYFMSYAFDQCMSQFSQEQMDAMVMNVLTEKEDFLNQDPYPGQIDPSSFTPLYPENAAFVEEISSLTFSWEPVANATNYEIQVSPLSSFSVLLFSEETTEPSATYYNLPTNLTLYWRVRPSNSFTACQKWSGIFTFDSGELTSTQTVSSVENLSIHPVPAQSGEPLQLRFTLAEAAKTKLQLLDLHGRMVVEQEANLSAGAQAIQFGTADLPAGVYWMQLLVGDQWISRKVVITQ